MRSARGRAEHGRPAFRAEAAAHGIAAVSSAPVIADLSAYPYHLNFEKGVDGGVAGGQIEAISTLAGAGHERRFVTGVRD